MNKKTSLTHFLSCDWGTTSFRLKRIALGNGESSNSIQTSAGIKKMTDEIPPSTEESAEACNSFQNYLASQIGQLEKRLSIDLAGIPVLISGMASSSIGWKELPYGTLPLSLKNPTVPVWLINATNQFPHNVLLISGISGPDNVMRGEETQILGLSKQHNLHNGLCILPGTHSKHIVVNHTRIIKFNTYMTGELFELICTHSILKNSLQSDPKKFHKKAFRQGVDQALHFDVLQKLFPIRAKDLLNNTNREENYDLLSGLLIGSELKNLKDRDYGKYFLASGEMLQQRYAVALEMLGLPFIQVDPAAELTARGQCILLDYYRKNNPEFLL